MKHYLDLVPISAKVQHKKNRMTRICILLSVFLVTAIFSMADMEIRTQKIQTIHNYGNWHAMFRQLDQTEAALLAARPEVEAASSYTVRNYRLEENYTIGQHPVVVCGFEESFLQIFPASVVTEGTYCAAPDSAVLTESAKKLLGIALGNTVQLTLPDGQLLPLTVSGFSPTTALLNQGDALGVYLSPDTYAKLPAAAQEESTLYVQFSPLCNIQKTLQDIRAQFQLDEGQVAENTQLLALLLQSRDSYMMKFYLVAAILSVLVLIAGVLMIASSLNSNVAQRTQFFGLLRCLGATERQIIRFVRYEVLNWCKTAIPLGIGAAILVSWFLCALLRFLSPNLFAGMPALGVSWPAIAVGALVGVATVLLAARTPARRAARVSPRTAISGNAYVMPTMGSAADTKFFPVHVALGIQHATASKKNFLLMVGSFAFSIILFLSFSTAIDFMHHAVTPLRPYTADISITSTDKTCSIPLQLAQQLGQEPTVKRVYGRSFAYQLPVQLAGQERMANLVSYEAQQFQWAQDELLAGTLSDVAQGTAVAIVYQNEADYQLHDAITFSTDAGVQQVPIQAMLSVSPFSWEPGVETVICSEALFQQLTGQTGYTVLDLQLTAQASQADVDRLRALAGTAVQFSDKRMGNSEAKGAYYAMALFLYGFLAVITLIAFFHIINTMAMSVSARLQQYGIMRALGMSDRQVLEMIAAEAGTYTLWGAVVGCLLGLPLNRLLFHSLVSTRWGDAWTFPASSVLCILLAVAIASLFAILKPARQIKQQAIVDTIHAL